MRLHLWATVSLIILNALQVHAASAPIIYQIDPPEAWYQGSWNPITIRGANLAGTTKVTIGGNLATSLTVVDDNTVTFKAPAQVPSPVKDPTVAYAKADLVLTTRDGAVTLPKAVQYSPPPGTGVTAKGSDWAVLVEAVVSATPSPSITLKWPLESRATGYEISRKARCENAWAQVGTVANPASATLWQDTNVAVGQAYEYQVKRTATILAYTDSWAPRILTPLVSYGYINSGINLPPVDHRGTVILIVDNTIAGACSAELAMLRDDLIGDGWSVIRHDVGRGTINSSKGPGAYEKTGAPMVKQLIVNEYLKNPKEVKSVYLFGHVPVPYSGNFTPTGHAPGHTGAFPADVYYGDMDGVWTDSVVNVQTADANSYYYTCWNIPGDGKFDQSWAPSEVELEVGRVDLWGMEGWDVSEIKQLKQYITKSHNHRHALNVAPRRTLIMEGSGDNWIGISQSGWRSWAPLVGSGSLDSGWFYPKLVTNNEAYLGFCLSGSGDNGRVGSGNRPATVYAADFYKSDPKVVFCMTWGSHHGDWDHPSNLLRAPLGSATCGLVNMYSYYPTSYLHTLGLGATFGETIRLKQNNTTAYSQYDPSHSGGVHIALMGDPTLRLFAVKPPSALAIGKDGSNHPMLSWQASTDSPLLGYHVYRSADRNGPFTRLTTNPVTQTTWTDSSITAGTFTYQVKAAKLETTASGTYINTSQAVAETVTAAPNSAGVLEFISCSYAQDEGASSPLKITATRTGGSSGAVSVNYATSCGTATPGSDYTDVQSILTWADGDSSPKSFTVPILDDLTVEPDETISLGLGSPTRGATLGTSAAVLTIANDDGPGTIYQVSPVAVKEGNSGITKMTITCLRVGGATGRVELNYATCAPGRMVSINYPTFPSAYPWLSDYDTAQGTLIWADGDRAPKTFDINVHGNLKAEYDKFIPIHYSAKGGATVKHPESFHNYILNDD